jgi:hypothetical protein
MLPVVFLRKRPLVVPEPGQRVRLRTARGRWRGSYWAVSEPYTDEEGVVVIRVAEEEEYRTAMREGRRAIGMPWPVRQVAAILPSAGADEDTGELPTVGQRLEKPPRSAAAASDPRPSTGDTQEGTEPRSWGRRWF